MALFGRLEPEGRQQNQNRESEIGKADLGAGWTI